jgi:hypothetical protein
MMPLPKKNPSVVFQRMDGGAVLLSTENEIYFGLNEVGALIWELMTPELKSFDDLRDAVAQRYPDVDPNVIAVDLADVLAELQKAGIVVES